MKNDNVKFKNIINLINSSNIGPIFFISPNPNRAIGLEKIIKNCHIICSQNSDIVNLLKKEKVPVLCINNDDVKNSGKLLEDKKVLNYIKRKTGDRTTNIVTFKPSPKLQKICAENKFRYLGNDWRLNRKFEDKVEFAKITNKLGIPNAQSEIVMVENSDKFRKIFNSKRKYVVQLPRGFSGNSTFLINNKNDLNNIIGKYKNRKVKIAKYLRGETYTINACACKFGVAVSQPIYQITGLTSYNKNKFGTSGNDYAYANNLSVREKEKIFNCAQKIGNYISSLGYKGIFGLDIIVNKGSVDLIEINPRLVGSIPVFTKLQIGKNQVPFLLLQLLEFSGKSYEVPEKLNPFLSLDEWLREGIFNASQIILRNTGKNDLKIAKSFSSGIYELTKKEMILKEKSYYLRRNLEKNEFLIQYMPAGSVINPDMEYANIQADRGIITGGKLDKKFGVAIGMFLKKMKFANI